MKLSTGKVAIPIEFDNGDKDNIYFNPNDPDLILRMRKLEGNVSAKIKDLADVELKEDGTPVDKSLIDVFEKAQGILKDELDKAFGGAVSAVVFKHCSPFAIVEGNYFIFQFIETVLPVIEKHNAEASIAAKNRMAKHIAKYAK